jgi:hypothetical protein
MIPSISAVGGTGLVQVMPDINNYGTILVPAKVNGPFLQNLKNGNHAL